MKVPRGPVAADAVWTGAVALEGEVVVPRGRRLVVAPGAAVTAAVAGARLVVEGLLDAAGASFGGPGWDGVAVRGRGRLRARGSGFASSGPAVETVELGSAVLRSCDLRGGEAALLASGFSRAALTACRLSGDGAGLLLRGDAFARARRCAFDARAAAASASGCARLELDDARSTGAESGVWLAARARARVRGGSFDGGDFGLRASAYSELEALGVATSGQRVSGVLVEGDARARLRACADASARGGPALLDRARVDADASFLSAEAA